MLPWHVPLGPRRWRGLPGPERREARGPNSGGRGACPGRSALLGAAAPLPPAAPRSAAAPRPRGSGGGRRRRAPAGAGGGEDGGERRRLRWRRERGDRPAQRGRHQVRWAAGRPGGRSGQRGRRGRWGGSPVSWAGCSGCAPDTGLAQQGCWAGGSGAAREGRTDALLQLSAGMESCVIKRKRTLELWKVTCRSVGGLGGSCRLAAASIGVISGANVSVRIRRHESMWITGGSGN